MKQPKEQGNKRNLIFDYKNNKLIEEIPEFSLQVPQSLAPILQKNSFHIIVRAFLVGKHRSVPALVANLKNLSKDEKAFSEALSCVAKYLKTKNIGEFKKILNIMNLTNDMVGFVMELPVAPGFVTAEDSNLSALFQLSTTNEGLSFFFNIFKQYPWLISADAFCRTRGPKAKEHANTSALFWWSFQNQLLDFLLGLFKKPTFCEGITAKALCLRATDEAYKNMSPLYFFSSGSKGHDILEQLLTYNPNIAKYITADDLRTKLPNRPKNTIHYLSTPLYQLCTTNPTDMELLENSDLNSFGNNTLSALGFMSSFCPTFGSLKILNKLFTLNPALAKTLPAKAICETRPNGCPNAGDSVLKIWTETTRGRALLFQCIDANETFAKELTIKPLCYETKSRGNRKDPALHFLSSIPAGIKFLQTLSEKAPSLANKITAETLFTPYDIISKQRTQDSKHTVYHRLKLVWDKEGKKLLDLWQKQNPKLVELMKNPGKYFNPVIKNASLKVNKPPHALTEISREIRKELIQKLSNLTGKSHWKYSANQQKFWLRGNQGPLNKIAQNLKEKGISLECVKVLKSSNYCIKIAATELMRNLPVQPSNKNDNNNNNNTKSPFKFGNLFK